MDRKGINGLLSKIFKSLLFAGVLSLQGQSVGAASANPSEKQLIQIGVEVVEVDETRALNLGIQWLSSLHVSEQSVPALFQVGTFSRDPIFADLQFMEQNGAADLLANPKLVARDGTNATFHAGGEIPYATTQNAGSVTVEFKEYVVDLKINPHLNEQGLIELSLEAQVSSPDTQNTVTLSGNVVPGIRSRQATSEITLAPGSTLTLAGLLQNNKEWTRDGVPILMHIPLLKYLFSHKVKKLTKTSVVIFVTPTLLESPLPPVAMGPSHG